MYDSKFPKLFQDEPPVFRHGKLYENCWTDTIKGYCSEAWHWMERLTHNWITKKRPVYQSANINPHCQMLPDEIKNYWSNFRRNLKKTKIPFFLCLEPSDGNIVHAHLLCETKSEKSELKETLLQSLPSEKSELATVCIGEKKYPVIDFAYILKAKVSRVVNGRVIKDFHWKKRLLFVPKLPFDKVSYSANFWYDTASTIKADIKCLKKACEESSLTAGQLTLVDLLADMVGRQVHRKQIIENIVSGLTK